MKYDENKHDVVATFDPGSLPKIPGILLLIILLVLIYAIINFTIYVLIIFGYLLIHELIHWVARFCVTGEQAKFGFVGINPCVYSDGYTTRNNAIVQALAPFILVLLILIVGLVTRSILFDENIKVLFIINLGGSITDIQMILWYLKYPSISLCGDDGKKNYILLPKKQST